MSKFVSADSFRKKQEKIEHILAGYGRLAVAFSGGADSSLVLWSAIQALGPDNVLVLTSSTCLLPAAELERTKTWFSRHGIKTPPLQLFLDTDPLALADFVDNPVKRCYFCKKHAYSQFLEAAAAHGIERLADGTNADDMNSDRPGLQVIRELGIATPLAGAGVTKEQVRRISRDIGLDTWSLPSASCLATRIPTGIRITRDRLARIAELEEILIRQGFEGCRVRLDRQDFSTIFIEVREEDLERAAALPQRGVILKLFNDSAIKQVFLNLQGR